MFATSRKSYIYIYARSVHLTSKLVMRWKKIKALVSQEIVAVIINIR